MVPVFLEIFSGSGRLAQAFGRAQELVLTWDILFGPAYDLTKASSMHLILGWIRAGMIRGIHLGTPCTSFSRIRGVGAGPPALRSDSEPMGLASLTREADLSAVRSGNSLLRVSCQIFNMCIKCEVPCSLENPATSRLWMAPSIGFLLRRVAVHRSTTEFCMWGRPWRKSTSFMHYLVDLSVLEERRCLGCKRGFCKRTGRPHIQLMGRGTDGRF